MSPIFGFYLIWFMQSVLDHSNQVHTIQPFWLICLLYHQPVSYSTKHNLCQISLIEMDWYLGFLKLVSINGKGTTKLGKGGLERPEGREGRLSVNQLWCQFQQRPRKQLLLQTKLLTFQLDGATTIAHLRIKTKIMPPNKLTLQSPIVQLGASQDSESRSNGNLNTQRENPRIQERDLENGFFLRHTGISAAFGHVFPCVCWDQIRFFIQNTVPYFPIHSQGAGNVY